MTPTELQQRLAEDTQELDELKNVGKPTPKQLNRIICLTHNIDKWQAELRKVGQK